jgi:hypothetical protein
MTFLDTGIMVGAVLKAHPEHELCLSTGFDLARTSPDKARVNRR